jgi:hypothetical protein
VRTRHGILTVFVENDDVRGGNPSLPKKINLTCVYRSFAGKWQWIKTRPGTATKKLPMMNSSFTKPVDSGDAAA